MSMAMPMNDPHPTAGVRVLLELKDFDGGGARYSGAIFTPTTRFDYRLRIALPDGAVTFVEPPQSDAAAYQDLVHAMARSMARDALASTPFSWPHRLFRWRDK
jgi:hypothetical protein